MVLLMKIDLEALPHQMETPISRYIHLQPSRTPVSLFISSDYFWLMACNLPHRGVFSIRESVTLFLHFYPDNCLPKKITHMFCTPFCHLFHFLFFLSSSSSHLLISLLSLAGSSGNRQTTFDKVVPVACRHAHRDTQPTNFAVFSLLNL